MLQIQIIISYGSIIVTEIVTSFSNGNDLKSVDCLNRTANEFYPYPLHRPFTIPSVIVFIVTLITFMYVLFFRLQNKLNGPVPAVHSIW